MSATENKLFSSDHDDFMMLLCQNQNLCVDRPVEEILLDDSSISCHEIDSHDSHISNASMYHRIERDFIESNQKDVEDDGTIIIDDASWRNVLNIYEANDHQLEDKNDIINISPSSSCIMISSSDNSCNPKNVLDNYVKNEDQLMYEIDVDHVSTLDDANPGSFEFDLISNNPLEIDHYLSLTWEYLSDVKSIQSIDSSLSRNEIIDKNNHQFTYRDALLGNKMDADNHNSTLPKCVSSNFRVTHNNLSRNVDSNVYLGEVKVSKQVNFEKFQEYNDVCDNDDDHILQFIMDGGKCSKGGKVNLYYNGNVKTCESNYRFLRRRHKENIQRRRVSRHVLQGISRNITRTNVGLDEKIDSFYQPGFHRKFGKVYDSKRY